MLWIFNHYIALPTAPGGVRHLSLARQLQTHGWDVCLICATTEAKPGGRRLGTWPPRHQADVDGIRVMMLRVPKYDGNGARRVANMSAFGAAAALPTTTRELPPADIVIGSSVHPLAAWAGACQAKRMRVPFVFEIRDLWPETLISLGRIERSSHAARALYALESKVWNQSSMVLSPLAQIPRYAKDRGLPVRRFLHIPNGAQTDAFDPTPLPRRSRLRLGYFGSHGNTDYLETIVEALAQPDVRLRADEFSVHFFGWGPRKQSLRELAGRLGAANLEFHDPVDRTGIASAMRAMDAFIFPLGDSHGLYQYGASPNKLPDYMAAGRPILMNAPFQGDPVTASGGGGILVPECTPAAWGKSLLEFLELSPEERNIMGARLRELAVAEYDFVLLGGTLDGGLRSVMDQ